MAKFPDYLKEMHEKNAETFSAEEDSKEYLIEIRNTFGGWVGESATGLDKLVSTIQSIVNRKPTPYAIDVFVMGDNYQYRAGRVITSPRKIHMATIKYGKAESGPLAAKLNESIDFRAESEHQDWPNYEDLVFDDDGDAYFYADGHPFCFTVGHEYSGGTIGDGLWYGVTEDDPDAVGAIPIWAPIDGGSAVDDDIDDEALGYLMKMFVKQQRKYLCGQYPKKLKKKWITTKDIINWRNWSHKTYGEYKDSLITSAAESISVWDEDYVDLHNRPAGWWYDAQCDECGITFKNAAREDKIWIITVGGGWYRGKKGDRTVLLFCNECQEDAWDESDWDTIIDFGAETVDWTDADLFMDWLKDENLIFHELSQRTHKGPNYGVFRRWANNYGILQPTRAAWEESNFHIFNQTSRELMREQSPYPFQVKAEEGLQVMAAALSGFLVDLSHRAENALEIDEWNDIIIIVDFSDTYTEDQLIMVFPDESEIELELHNPKTTFIYDEQDDIAELDWTVGLKIVMVDGSREF